MTKLFGKNGRATCAAVTLTCLMIGGTWANAAELKEARVTQVIQDVKLLPSQAAPRPAVVSDPVREGTAVRTGVESRAELTFTDQTLTRLGANTLFSFSAGTRVMSLGGGAILFHVPKGTGGATIKTAAVTAAITGTTGIGEFHPASATSPRPFSKWLCLEGTFRLYLPNGESVELSPGKTVTTDGTSFSEIMTFDIGQVLRTSLLVNGFDTELASLALIQFEQQRQLDLLLTGGLEAITVANLNDPARLVDIIDQGMVAKAESSASPSITPTPTPFPPTPTPTPLPPTPTPSKFGTPAVIAADPYIIDENTTIQTDPSITKNGVTDFGKIYRGPAIDGSFSNYAFGSTSAFDTYSGFDDQIDDSGAVFKFTSLQLIGDPTILTAGGELDLALIGVNGITSGGPGATLTFAGLNGLLLATQNGSISLGSEISFSGLNDLTFYARGAGLNLTLACAISTLSELNLYSEGDVNLSSNVSTLDFRSFSGGEFNLTAGSIDAETISIISGNDVNFSLAAPLTFNTTDFLLQADENIQVSGSLDVTQNNDGQTEGLNIFLLAGGNINIGGDLRLTTDASDIQNGGNIVVTSGGDTTIGGSFELTTFGLSGTATGTGGTIDVTTGGNFTAGDLNFTVDYNVTDVTVADGANLSLNVAGNLTTTLGGIQMSIFTPISNTLTNGGNLTLDVGGNLVTAAAGDLTLRVVNTISTTVPNGANLSASIGGDLTADVVIATIENDTNGGIGTGGNLAFNVSGNLNASSLFAQLSNTDGGDITNGGNVTLDVGGNLVTTGAATFQILNNEGGHIGTGGNITVATGDFTAGSIIALINNRNGGTIESGANIEFNIGGTLTTTGDATFVISNRDDGNGAGAIGSNVSLTLTAANLNIGGALTTAISNNGGGHIGGSAQNSTLISGDLTTQSFASFTVENTGYNVFGGSLIAGGTIDVSAGVDVSAEGNISIGDILQVAIFNRGDGSIGSDATINFFAGGNLMVGSDALFTIGNADIAGGIAGSIGGDATINLSANDISVEGALSLEILNQVAPGILNPSGDSGGNIGGDATVNVAAENITANSLLAQIDNTGGSIGGTASIIFNLSGALTTTGDANFDIFSDGENFDGGSIDVSAGSMNIGGSLLAGIRDGLTAFDPGSVLIHADDDIIVGDEIRVGGSITAGGDITAVNSITFTGSTLMAGGDIISSAGSISFDAGNSNQLPATITAGGDISAATFLQSFPGITAGGSVTAASIFANTLTAGTNITIRAIGGGAALGILVDMVSAGGNLILMNTQQVRPNGASSGGGIGFTPNDFLLSVDSIMSTGPTFPVLFSNGSDAVPNVGNNNPGNGGNIFMNINADGLDVGAGADLNNIEANGGDYATTSTAGGDGGTVNIVATGDVNLNDGANGESAITAYTGFIPTGGPFTLGDGGTVNIETPGTINVNSTIEVSSNQLPAARPPNGTTPPGRRSARGGNINLRSSRAAGPDKRTVAINVTNSGQLLSLLNAAAPGPGGTITILATGANSNVNVRGRVQADRGTVDIQHSANGGRIALGDASPGSIDMRADVIKAGVFGANGQLIVGDGFLSADSTLKLYAPGSNGQINFIANVTLSSGSGVILAGDTITIQPTRVVTIAGNGGAAQVFTNNANYAGFGGNNPDNGTFAGNGANDPLPLPSAPPFNPTSPGH